MWEAKHNDKGAPHLARKLLWPYVNHFNLIDPDWGHITLKVTVSG